MVFAVLVQAWIAMRSASGAYAMSLTLLEPWSYFAIPEDRSRSSPRITEAFARKASNFQM
jgi:hypothetical protein